MERNWPAFGANVAVTNNTARAANNIPGYSTTRLTTSSMGLSSEDHAIDFSMSPQSEGTLLHDDSGLARQRRHKKKSSGRHHTERRSERHNERTSERNSERNSERQRMKKEES